MSIEDIRKRTDSVITVSEFVSPRTAAIITELCGDRLALLVKVDRLRAEADDAERDLWRHIDDERARILAAVEGLRVSPTAHDENPWQVGFRQSRNETVSAVLDIVEGKSDV